MAESSPHLFRPAVQELTPYQPGKPIEDVQRELGLERIVKLASNEGPFPPFPAALEAMERAARELNRYPDGGVYRLHEALAARHGVAFGQIAVGAGADGCLDMLSQATLDPGDEVVCGWPPRRRPADVLEDLRARGTAGRVRGGTSRRRRGDDEDTPPVRRHEPGAGGGAREHGRSARDRAAPSSQRRGARTDRPHTPRA